MDSQEGLSRPALEPTPLLPVFIAVDREGLSLRENILWPVSGTYYRCCFTVLGSCFLVENIYIVVTRRKPAVSADDLRCARRELCG